MISDEVYDHLAFAKNPFVSMGNFGSIVPVVTLGSLSKRFIVPGWRLGWLVTHDPNGILKQHGVISLSYTNIINTCFMQTHKCIAVTLIFIFRLLKVLRDISICPPMCQRLFRYLIDIYYVLYTSSIQKIHLKIPFTLIVGTKRVSRNESSKIKSNIYS